MAGRWGWGGALLVCAALGIGCEDEPASPLTDAGVDGPSVDAADGPTDVAQTPTCAWDPRVPRLDLSQAEVSGTLRGTSRNASTTCTRSTGTGGPESIYFLQLDERTLVDIEVESEIDTVLALRRVCDDPLTEIACNDSERAASTPARDGGFPLPFPADAGAIPDPGTTGRDAHLRATLEPGDYFLLVDEAEAFGVGGAFKLHVRATPLPAQISCLHGQAITGGTRLVDEELDLAVEKGPCGEGQVRPALFYRARIPSGERLTVRTRATAGDRTWTPTLDLFTSCPQTMIPGAPGNLCMASDRDSSDGQRLLRYINNGPDEQNVLLSVSPSAAVKGGRFRLEANMGPPQANLSCATAHALSDSEVLANQDLSDGQPSDGRCQNFGAPTLWYSATLFPQQSVRLTVTTPFGDARRFTVLFLVRDGCDLTCNNTFGDDLVYLNNSTTMKTIFIEATTFAGVPLSPFDMRVEMALPPGGLNVTAARGLATGETGTTATFQVELTSPVVQFVEIPLASSDPAEGTVSPAKLVFTADNWRTPQTVTVTGVDDGNKDGPRPYRVTVGPSVSQDRRYEGLSGGVVSLVNRDDEPGFAIEAPAVLVTSESGGQAKFRVMLQRAPSATVRLPLASSEEGEATISPAELVFEPGTWNQAQTVTLTGVDDDARDGSVAYRALLGAATSDDGAWAGIDPTDLDARNSDNDFEKVAAQVVSGNLSCVIYGNGQRIAVDQATTVYVGMICQAGYGGYPDAGGAPWPDAGAASVDARPSDRPFTDGGLQGPTAMVAVSEDGGRTFSDPIDTGLPTYQEMAIAGGRPGVVFIAASTPGGVVLTRSEDAARTWQVVLNRRYGHSLRLAAAGDRVSLLFEGEMGSELWISSDGGARFLQQKAPPFGSGVLATGIDAASGAFWVVGGIDNRQFLRTSTDGATFQDETEITLTTMPFYAFAVGPTKLYAGAAELVAVTRGNSAMLTKITGLPSTFNYPPVLIADEKDNLTVLSSGYAGLELRRLTAGETTLSTARALGSSDNIPSGVALSDSATAFVVGSSGRVWASVEIWP